MNYDLYKPQESLQAIKGSVEGMCYLGVCAVVGASPSEGVTVLVAANIEDLEAAWNKIAKMPLGKDGIQEVAIFQQKDLKT